jgi:hypothetical protein
VFDVGPEVESDVELLADGSDVAVDTYGSHDATDDASDAHPALEGTEAATFEVRPGVEVVTVFGATPSVPLTLYDAGGAKRLSVIADTYGQAHFAYLPKTYATIDPTTALAADFAQDGTTVPPGGPYVIRDDTQTPPRASRPFRVLAIADTPYTALYDRQVLEGVPFGLLGVPDDVDPQDGLHYIEMRDGVLLSAMVRLPDPGLWGEGPYPTVVEYSGYAPSSPEGPSTASRIATLLGYASVGVNMRGSGCSGGVFDVFSPAQQADGYDLVEAIARQPWVKGHKVALVGLSYPGISQLYVAATAPPSLAAITPMSVMADSWQQLRPGGIYNDGFTRQWLAQRDAEAAPDGQSWTEIRIAWGDARCAEHQLLRNQNMKFEALFKALEFFPDTAVARSLPRLVPKITVPVYLSGGFQDEQTGPQFADMLDRFVGSPLRRFVLYNGRHPDGFAPGQVSRWWEFLELYLADRVPRLPGWMRELGAAEFSREFDSEGLTFEADRFAAFDDDDPEGVRAAYEAETEVRVLFEVGGDETQPGAPAPRFISNFEQWPPRETKTTTYFIDYDSLTPTPSSAGGVDAWRHDPEAGGRTFFGPRGYELMRRLWDLDWSRFGDGHSLSYITAPLDEDLILVGPGYAELWISSDAADVTVQVSLSEVRPDGLEVLVTSGWLRPGHRALDDTLSHGNYMTYTYRREDFRPLAPQETVHTRVPLPSVAHVLRAGSRLQMTVSTPGRNQGTWEFEAPDYGGTTPSHRLTWGGSAPSALHLTTLDPATASAQQIRAEMPRSLAACPGLRGQPCRAYAPTQNRPAP